MRKSILPFAATLLLTACGSGPANERPDATKLDPCTKKNARCLDCTTSGDSYRCENCLYGFGGHQCDTCAEATSVILAEVCVANRCTGNDTHCAAGSCSTTGPDEGDFSCSSCKGFWTGNQCETCSAALVEGECIADQCVGNDANCAEDSCVTTGPNPGAFTCAMCKAGWAGTQCETCADISAVIIAGVCVPNRCTETDVHCTEGSCLTNGPNPNDYICSSCVDPWVGTRCETCSGVFVEGQCVINRCTNDNNCAEAACNTTGPDTGNYSCASCKAGWAGAQCDACADAEYFPVAGTCVPDRCVGNDDYCEPDTCVTTGPNAGDSACSSCRADRAGPRCDACADPSAVLVREACLPSPCGANGCGSASQIASGHMHSCALLNNGSVMCWGSNIYSQLGDGTTTERYAPVAVKDGAGILSNVSSIATSGVHTCALLNTGSVRCWGLNLSGQLGDGTQTNQSTPVPVKDGGVELSNVAALAAGGGHTCALLETSSVKCWGSNHFGELGDGTQTDQSTPVFVMDGASELSNVSAIAASGGHTCALLKSGSIKCWGENDFGQLGDGTQLNRRAPSAVMDGANALSNVNSIAAGGDHTCALLKTGSVKCWGRNQYGQLGIEPLPDRNTPTYVMEGATALTNVAAIVAGYRHTCALLNTGAVKCWGVNLGGGTIREAPNTEQSAPVVAIKDDTGELSNVSALSAGDGNTCALLNTGAIKCWGGGSQGQLGDNAPSNQSRAISVVDSGYALRAVTSVAAGTHHTCALLEDGTAKCWGSNSEGQVGDGFLIKRSTPLAVQGLMGATAIAAGSYHTCALLGAGTVKCWGSNYQGQLSAGSAENRVITPTPVIDGASELSNTASLATGGSHTCALLNTGTVKCWGDNSEGQLGDGTTTTRTSPSIVMDNALALSGVTDIAAGRVHTCALLNTGSVKCWGNNYYGQLGDSTTTRRLTPTTVQNLAEVRAIRAGGEHICALLNDGSVKCWGNNANGQLGDGTTIQRTKPVVTADISGATAIAAGGSHSCAIIGEHVECWGSNLSGQLGDGTATQRTTAVAVKDLRGTLLGVKNITAGALHSCALLSTGSLKCWGDTFRGQLGDSAPMFMHTVSWIAP